MKQNDRRRAIPDYVDTLDGFRALAACLVMLFHYWQQSWLSMVIHIGSWSIDLTPIVSIGSMGVELLFVLSGFCLYYPLAMHPQRRLHVGQYIYKRLTRILPMYILCVLIGAAYQVGKLSDAALKTQLIADLTLTQMMTKTASAGRINGVLWSIAIEAQFYVLFPIILPLFRKKPYLVSCIAFVIAEGLRMVLRDFMPENAVFFYTNQLFPMLDAFVGGMLSAHIAAAFKRTLNKDQKRALSAAFTVGTIGFFMLYILSTMYIYPQRYDDTLNNLSILQLHVRKFVILGFCGSIACSTLSRPWMHHLLGNPVTRYLSTISYQLYLWHIWIALRLKEWHIPAYSTERAMDDASWRLPYWLLSIGLSLAAATLLTYGLERPLARFFAKHMPHKKEAKHE